jgi:hypothetical protein
VQRDAAAALAGVEGHASEAEQKGIPDDAFDVLLDNNDTFQHLYAQIDRRVVPLADGRR